MNEQATSGTGESIPKMENRRQIERAVPGFPGLREAIYPSGRKAYILRFRDPVSGERTSKTLSSEPA